MVSLKKHWLIFLPHSPTGRRVVFRYPYTPMGFVSTEWSQLMSHLPCLVYRWPLVKSCLPMAPAEVFSTDGPCWSLVFGINRMSPAHALSPMCTQWAYLSPVSRLYRMSPGIADLIRPLYPGLVDHPCVEGRARIPGTRLLYLQTYDILILMSRCTIYSTGIWILVYIIVFRRHFGDL